MHAVGCLLGTTNEWNRLGLTAVNAIGNMGVTTFMLISGYFGIHFRWSKLFTLWLITLFYSFIATGADLLLGAEPSAQLVYRALTPVTSLRWWFLSYYLIIFCLSPVLNRLFVVLSQREVEWMLGMLICCFILCPTLLQHPLTGDAEGKGLANLLTAYLVGGFFRPVLTKLAEILTQGFPHAFGHKELMPVVTAVVVAVEIALVLAVWRKARRKEVKVVENVEQPLPQPTRPSPQQPIRPSSSPSVCRIPPRLDIGRRGGGDLGKK
jgi:hypothetical protein